MKMKTKSTKTTVALIAAAVIIVAALIVTAVLSSGRSAGGPKNTGTDIVPQEMLDELIRQAEEAEND